MDGSGHGERLEQQDAYLTAFRASVTAVEERDGAPWAALDRSAFYPESGGQPADAGRLGGAVVVDVQLRSGRVWHRLERGSVRPGDAVEGAVDWDRRFRHMQRHTAQHLLSQALLRVDEAFATRSASLAGSDCTLDLDGDPTAAALADAEALVNRVAYRNLPIRCFEVDESELGGYALRRPPKVRGRIRLVEMGDFEISACGGTHLARTAEAAPVKVLGAERVRAGRTRVTFRAGLEALEDYRAKHDAATAVAASFSARVDELVERVAALREAERTTAQALSATRARLAAALAERWWAEADPVGGRRVVRRVLDAAEADLLRPVAEALAGRPDTVALLGARADAKGVLVFARSGDVAIDLRPVLAAGLQPLDGRGGGRPELVQGAGPRRDALEAALERAHAALGGQP